jgi:hypothetical protein
MYDAPKVIAGLVLFLSAATLPFWIGLGDPSPPPEPVIMAGTEQCVEPPEFMRPNHMTLLDEWRNSVVRDDDRIYVSSSGRKFEKSLTRTCLECHSNKAQFCEECHKSVAVKPYCWGCHLVPEVATSAGAPVQGDAVWGVPGLAPVATNVGAPVHGDAPKSLEVASIEKELAMKKSRQ